MCNEARSITVGMESGILEKMGVLQVILTTLSSHQHECFQHDVLRTQEEKRGHLAQKIGCSWFTFNTIDCCREVTSKPKQNR